MCDNYERHLFSIKDQCFLLLYSQADKRSNLGLKITQTTFVLQLFFCLFLQFSEQVETIRIFLKGAEVLLSKNLAKQQIS